MTDVLGALEDAEGQRGQEVAGGEQTSGRTQSESGVLPQEGAHVVQLWDLVLHKDSLLLQHCENGTVL